MDAPLDFSNADTHEQLVNDPLCVAVNEAIDRAMLTQPRLTRGYLGASAVGDHCERKIQFDWMCDSLVDARQARIFARGHAFEAMARAQLLRAGFHFAPDEALAFVACDGFLQGHADGLIVGAPAMPGVYFPTPAIWEHKAVKNDSWTRLARDGLNKVYPAYATQVALYQHFLGKRNPALFSVVNANDCRALHFHVPYDPVRVADAIERVARIVAATKEGTLLQRGHPSPDSWQCKRSCGHARRCWSAR